MLETGTFSSLDNQVDTQTGTVRAKARFANDKGQLFPSQFVNVQLRLRTIEGAAQRVQEDTMRFARIMEGLGVELMRSLMTLAAFLPILWVLSDRITSIPVLGAIPHSLVWVSLGWAVFGALLGVHLGMIAVFGHLTAREDERTRIQTATIAELERTNTALQQALDENAALHAQLLVQAREAGVADERRRLAAEIPPHRRHRGNRDGRSHGRAAA